MFFFKIFFHLIFSKNPIIFIFILKINYETIAVKGSR